MVQTSAMGSGNVRTNNGDSSRTERPPHPGFLVRVSKRFLVLSLLSGTLVAFAVGRTARTLILVRPQVQALMEIMAVDKEHEEEMKKDGYIMKLPNPVLKNGKQPPPTLYTSKNFDTARSAAIFSRWVVTEEGSAHGNTNHQLPSGTEPECQVGGEDSSSSECSSCRGGGNKAASGEGGEGDDEVHLPVGQHLLMDIRNVDASFLASEERLANAMLDVVGECGLTLLSYHCHGLHPAGVSCVGVLLESHVSFHTWPTEGVITLDLFTCGPTSLLPIVAKVQELFSVPRPWAINNLMEMPEVVWAYKWRGFGEQNQEHTAALTDLFTFPIGAMTEYKKEIASQYIGSERIDIYDVLRSPYQTLESYKRMLTDATSYEAQNPVVFEPDRIAFTNGVLQSRRSSGTAFYEMFVHPAMFAHRNPKRVAAIGFGDGAILRELLKHKNVEQMMMLEYEEELLNLTMKHFPEYHDCSFLGSDKANCLDDPRVTTHYGDIEKWFGDHQDSTAVKFDVVILDEEEIIGHSDTSLRILKDIHGSMADNGVLVASMGFSPTSSSPSAETDSANGFHKALIEVGFESVLDYEEGHLGYEWPWRFVIAFKSLDAKRSWFRHDALTNVEIKKRIVPAIDGSLPLLVFDGAVQHSIMYRSSVDGRRRGFDPESPNLENA